jgi:DNA-binding NarL/FixJ family response regulator
MTKFKIYIVEGEAMFRAGIKQALSSMKERVECTDLMNLTQLMTQMEIQQPDMILMNLELDENSISITEQFIKKYDKVKIILFATRMEDEVLLRLIDCGVYGCLLRSAELSELKLAIEMVMNCQCYFSPQLVNSLLLHRLIPSKNGNKRIQRDNILTDRELEIVKLLCKGCDQQEIAEKLFISPRTVDAHKANIMSKLDVKSTTGIILHAIKHHVIKLEELT